MFHPLRAARDERGVSAVEYGVIAALIAVVIISVVAAMGGSLSGVFGNIGTSIAKTHPGTTDGEITDPLNPSQDTCDEDGNYVGPTLWMKLDWGGIEWDSYPTGAAAKFKSYVTANGATILVADAAARDEDGAPGFDFLADYNPPACGESTTPGDGGGDSGGSDDPNCSDGNYVGSTDDWYWVKTEFYDTGEYVTTASGTEWSGNSKPETVTPYTYEERGALIDQDNITSGRMWRDPQSGNIYVWVNAYTGPIDLVDFSGWGYVGGYGHWLVYENGVMFSLSAESADEMLATGQGRWLPYSTHVTAGGTYSEDERGNLTYTVWSGSPTDNGGVQMAAAPAGDDSVEVDFDYYCSGGVLG